MQNKSSNIILITLLVIIGITLSLISLRSIFVLLVSGLAAITPYNVGRMVGCLITSILAYKSLRRTYEIFKNKKNSASEQNQSLTSVALSLLCVFLIVPITLTSIALLGDLGFTVPFLLLNTLLLIERRKRAVATKTINTVLLIVLNSIGLLLLVAALVLYNH